MVENKKLNWSRDDVYIISLNGSSDRIEDTKIQCYTDPIKVYVLFAMIEALYDKSWKYMRNHQQLSKDMEAIQAKLWDKQLLKDIESGSRKKSIDTFLLTILSKLTIIYRELTGNYVDTGLFPKYNVESDEVGAVRESRLN